MLGFRRSAFYLVLGVCAAAAGSVHTAQAADPSDVIETVRTGDLDVASPEGAAKLRHRIALAARNVCAWVDPDKRIDLASFADCVSSAAREAAPQTRAVLANAARAHAMFAGPVAAR